MESAKVGESECQSMSEKVVILIEMIMYEGQKVIEGINVKIWQLEKVIFRVAIKCQSLAPTLRTFRWFPGHLEIWELKLQNWSL